MLLAGSAFTPSPRPLVLGAASLEKFAIVALIAFGPLKRTPLMTAAAVVDGGAARKSRAARCAKALRACTLNESPVNALGGKPKWPAVLVSALLALALSGSANAMVTSTAPPDAQSAPPLDLSRFNPQAQGLAGLENPLAGLGLGGWTSSLSVSCAPSFGPYAAGIEPVTPLASAPVAQSCAGQGFGQSAFAGSPSFGAPLFGTILVPAAVLPSASPSRTAHFTPNYSGLAQAGRAPAGFGGGLQVEVSKPGTNAATVKHVEAKPVEAASVHEHPAP